MFDMITFVQRHSQSRGLRSRLDRLEERYTVSVILELTVDWYDSPQ